jgi:hypothetical protein
MLIACDEQPEIPSTPRNADDVPVDGETDTDSSGLVCEITVADVELEDPPAPEDIVARYRVDDLALLMLESWAGEASEVLGLTWLDEVHVTLPDSKVPITVVLLADDEQPILVDDDEDKGFRLYKNAKCDLWEPGSFSECWPLADKPGVYYKTVYAPRHICKAGKSWCVEELGLWKTTTHHSDKECKGPVKPEPEHIYLYMCNPGQAGNN